MSYATSSNCPDSTSEDLTVVETPDPAFSYVTDTFCLDSANPTPTVTASGGMFSGGAGLVIDPVTGIIDLTNSTLGTYTVDYSFGGLCPASSNVSVTIVDCSVGLYDRLDDLSMYQVYPNPNAGRFNLVNLDVSKDVTIQITDLTGKVVFQEEAELVQGVQKQIDMGEVSTGTYFLRVVDGNKVANFKLNVNRN